MMDIDSMPYAGPPPSAAQDGAASAQYSQQNPFASRVGASVAVKPRNTSPNKKRRSYDNPQANFPEQTWPTTEYHNGALSLKNCLIAGDSITRALQWAAATREIMVIPAPGCTSFNPNQVRCAVNDI